MTHPLPCVGEPPPPRKASHTSLDQGRVPLSGSLWSGLSFQILPEASKQPGATPRLKAQVPYPGLSSLPFFWTQKKFQVKLGTIPKLLGSKSTNRFADHERKSNVFFCDKIFQIRFFGWVVQIFFKEFFVEKTKKGEVY